MTHKVRSPAVAARFYPGDAGELHDLIIRLLRQAKVSRQSAKTLALIVPHAGLMYSGSTAAVGYRLLQQAVVEDKKPLFVIIGPSHHIGFDGLALSSAQAFETPLGRLVINEEATRLAESCEGVGFLDLAHRDEHCIEVQLPFIQVLFEHASILPILTGRCDAKTVAVLIKSLASLNPIFLISSDLSHFHTYEQASLIDEATARAVKAGNTKLEGEQACGSCGINGLNYYLSHFYSSPESVAITELQRINSGDIDPSMKNRVVGYGCFAATTNE